MIPSAGGMNEIDLILHKQIVTIALTGCLDRLQGLTGNEYVEALLEEMNRAFDIANAVIHEYAKISLNSPAILN